MIYTETYHSPVGKILLAEEDGALVGLWLEGQKHGLEVLSREQSVRETALLKQTKVWLDRYFAGENPDTKQLPLAPKGSAFRKMVWSLLLQIPYGQVTTYGQIAKTVAAGMGKPNMSAQAVGGAVGHNPVAIIVPCHRVIGSGFDLTGYDGGVHLKERLLAHEGIELPPKEIFRF